MFDSLQKLVGALYSKITNNTELPENILDEEQEEQYDVIQIEKDYQRSVIIASYNLAVLASHNGYGHFPANIEHNEDGMSIDWLYEYSDGLGSALKGVVHTEYSSSYGEHFDDKKSSLVATIKSDFTPLPHLADEELTERLNIMKEILPEVYKGQNPEFFIRWYRMMA